MNKERSLEGQRLVIASHNPGKLVEIADLLRPWQVDVISASALGLEEPEETEDSFAGNAKLKAVLAARAANLPALADDSGLVVDALQGDPGIFSARWAGPEKDFSIAMARVLKKLDEAKTKDRHARIVSALARAWPDGGCDIFEGIVEGRIADEPRGGRGFGYDPIFIPQGDTLTFGEMEPSKKYAISHRTRAFAKLVAACFGKENASS